MKPTCTPASALPPRHAGWPTKLFLHHFSSGLGDFLKFSISAPIKFVLLLQERKRADALLERALYDTEDIDMDSVFLAFDAYRNSILLTRCGTCRLLKNLGSRNVAPMSGARRE